MFDRTGYRKQLATTIAETGRAALALVKGYRTPVDSRAKTGALDPKTRERIYSVGSFRLCRRRIPRVAHTAMTHIAIQESLDGKPVEWLEKVTDEQYQARA